MKLGNCLGHSRHTKQSSGEGDWLAIMLLCIFVVLAAVGTVKAEVATVLIIYSYDEQLAWTKQCDQGIKDALPRNVRIERIYMNTKRIPQREFKDRAKEVLVEFREIKPDVVILSDDNALRLVGPSIATTGTPVVYLGINGNPRDYFDELPWNVIGVIERVPLIHWIRLIFEIEPEAKSILVLMDSSPTSNAIVTSSFQKRKRISFDGKEVVWKIVKDWPSWQRFVLEPKSDVILMPIYHALKDVDGVHVPFDKVVLWTSGNSSVPVFATQDYAVGDQGVAGAFVIVGEKHGYNAGLLAKGILEGKDISELTVADDQLGDLYFNYKQLHRFGLTLPDQIKAKATFK